MNDDVVISVYADGGCILKNPSLIGGTWAACHVNQMGERVWCDSGVLTPRDTGTRAVSNNQAEFWALLQGLRALPRGWSGLACSDSQITLMRFFADAKLANIPYEWVADMGVVKRRLGAITPVLLSGHPSAEELRVGVGRKGRIVSIHNVWADDACAHAGRVYLKQGART